jgi:hypothetical protein
MSARPLEAPSHHARRCREAAGAALAVALGLHAALMMAFGVAALAGLLAAPPGASAELSPHRAFALVEPPAGYGDGELSGPAARARLRRRILESRSLTPAQKRRRLAELAERARHLDAETVGEIGAHLGLEAGAYRPRPDAPEGPFDHADATLEDIEAVTGEEGQPGYRVTLVDRAGRTFSFEAYGEEAKAYEAAHRVFRMAAENPGLKRILDQLVKPYLADQQRGGAASTPPPSRAAPSGGEGADATAPAGTEQE